MPKLVIISEEWMPRDWHGVQGKERRWRTDDDGIHVKGEKKQRRTKGRPSTIRRIRKRFGNTITNMSEMFGIGEPMLAATIAIESGGKPKAERFEKHLADYSIGLMQTLTSTAYAVGVRIGIPTVSKSPDNQKPYAMPDKTAPKGSDVDEWRRFLSRPWNSIGIGAAYHQMNNTRFKLQLDPVLLYCSYNAGSARVHKSSANQWGVHHYGGALDWFVKWFNDACAVYGRSM
tara:strand:+ start:1190 stop:1882 length:693 start_codon:yes stop_codon:yes gene_type:complete